jgi:peroxiredoxin
MTQQEGLQELGGSPVAEPTNHAQGAAAESRNKELKVGGKVELLLLQTIQGGTVRIPDGEHLVHIQFRRFAGCPVCNLHIRSFVRRYDEILAAGVREVVVFYSDTKTTSDLQGHLPFPAIADPDKELFAKFGADRRGSFWRAYDLRLIPATWSGAFKEAIRGDPLRGARGNGEDKRGLPSEFLVGPDGRVLAAKYSETLNDHWSVDEILELSVKSNGI